MVVSVYCRVIFYADKKEAKGKKCLPHYGFRPTFTHQLCGLTWTFSGFPLGFPHRLKGKSILLKPLCNFCEISFLNEHFRTRPKVMRSLLPYFFWGVYWQAIAYHQPHFFSHHTYTSAHTFLLFVSLCLLVSLSSFQVHSHPPTPTHSLSVYVSPLALPHFFPISLLLKSETARNPTRFFFGQPRGNGSERGAQVRLQLLIKNLHCPAWRDVRNDFGFHL